MPINFIIITFIGILLSMRKITLLAALTHIAGLAIFLSLPILFIVNQDQNKSLWSTIFTINTLQFVAVYIFIFYFHTYFQIPRLYRKKKYILYFFILGLLFGAVMFLKPFDRLMRNNQHNFQGPQGRMHFSSDGETPVFNPDGSPPRDSAGFRQMGPPPPGDSADFMHHEPALHGDHGGFNSGNHFRGPREGMRGNMSPRIDIISIFLFAMTLAFSLSIEFRQRLREAEQRALKADADKANAELFFLKAQINPHFLFNTLNNIYSLAAVKSDKTAESIMKLSNIMRYVTEDVTENFVPLADEIAFMTDYIDLQRLRLGKKMQITVEMPGDPNGKVIAPLILMTFVENAFKYGISAHTDSEIIIYLIIHEYNIEFFCQNRISDKPREETAGTGIGIRNTRARLEHLYAGKHILNIEQEKGKFTVKLVLQT